MAWQEGVRERRVRMGAVPERTHADAGEDRLQRTRANIINQFRMRREAGAARQLQREPGDLNPAGSITETTSGRPAGFQPNDRSPTSHLPPPPAEPTPYNTGRRNAMVPGQYPSIGSDQDRVPALEARLAMMLARQAQRRPDVTLQYHIPTGAPYAPSESSPLGYLAVRQDFEQLLEYSSLTADRLIAVWQRQRLLTNDALPTEQGASVEIEDLGHDTLAGALSPVALQRRATSQRPFAYEAGLSPLTGPALTVRSNLTRARSERMLSLREADRQDFRRRREAERRGNLQGLVSPATQRSSLTTPPLSAENLPRDGQTD